MLLYTSSLHSRSRSCSGGVQPKALLALGGLLGGIALFTAGFIAGKSGASGPGGSAAQQAGAGGANGGRGWGGGAEAGEGGNQVTGKTSLGEAGTILSGTAGWKQGFGAVDAGQRFLQGAAVGMDVGLLEEELKRFSSVKDVPALLALLDGKDRSEPGVNGLYGVIFTIWGREDPEAALQWMHQQDDRGLVSRAASAIARTFAERDFNAAVDWMRRLPADMGRREQDRVIGAIFSEGAKTRPMDALRSAQDLETLGQRKAALSSLMREWAEIDFQTAWRNVDSITEAGIRGDVQGDMLWRVAAQGEVGRKQVLAMLDDLPTNKLANRGLRAVAESWANEDWEAAMKWANSLPADDGRESVLNTLNSRWARNNPDEALKEINGMAPGGARNRLLENAFNALSWQDPAAALERAGDLKSEDDMRQVVPRIISNLANMDPSNAADYVQALPEGRLKTDSAASLIERWSQDDPAAASEWLVEQPDGPSKDRAIENLVNRIRRDDSEAAVAWAASVSNEKNRVRLVESAVRDWKRQDPGAAANWVQNSSLPDDVKKRMLN